jgi:cell wall-associated NlpC family hydrolase
VFGGTGPCGAGFDCSGLTQAAWAAAGVSIPRTSEEQWAGLPHVSTSDLQPGDILVFNGAGHVGLYVGKGMLIDAPHSGLDVEEVALSGWYASTLDGAVRP